MPRGFRVATVAPGWFVFFLGGRGLGDGADALEMSPYPGEEAFLLGVAPLRPDPDWLIKGKAALASLGWRQGVVAILADFRRRASLHGVRKESRVVFRDTFATGAAFWVWQTMPLPPRGELTFFSVEQQLFQWGRVGRHVRRRCRWRRFLP